MSQVAIREAIEALGRKLMQAPDKARVKNAWATARLESGLRCAIAGPNGESAATDMPPAMGGAGSAPNPGWFMRASLASCAATAIAMRAAASGIELTTLEVTVESESDSRGLIGCDDAVSPALTNLCTRVLIGAENASEEQLQALARWGDDHSPVGCTVRAGPPLRLEVNVVRA
jgi:uncharacterized OsmC-like protein